MTWRSMMESFVGAVRQFVWMTALWFALAGVGWILLAVPAVLVGAFKGKAPSALVVAPVAIGIALVDLVPSFIWWGLLIALGLWVFFGALREIVRAAVAEALRDHGRR